MVRTPKANEEGYKLLYKLETKLRKVVIQVLNKKSKKLNIGGWVKLISKETVARCEKRRAKESNSPYQIFTSFSILDYSNFYNLKNIIIKNWDVFEKFFKDQNIVNMKFDEMEPIRNTIAHNRKLSEAELNRLKIIYKDINNCLSKRQR